MRFELLVAELDPLAAEQGRNGAVAPLQRRLDHVHRRAADETADEEIDGPVVELLGSRDLLQLALPHHRHAVAHGHRLDLVVRDVDGGRAEVPYEARDLRAQLHAQLRVQIGERLVHQKRLRLTDDRAAHRDTLALAAGKRPRLAFQQLLEAEDPGCVLDATVDLVLFVFLRRSPNAMLS
jgi:hypothetical protein